MNNIFVGSYKQEETKIYTFYIFRSFRSLYNSFFGKIERKNIVLTNKKYEIRFMILLSLGFKSV